MRIALAADHAGFVLKEHLRAWLGGIGHEVLDFGTRSAESTDYPDYARTAAGAVAAGEAERAVLVCSTGAGMAIAANKVQGIRATVAANPETVRLTRAHNDANVLAIGALFTEAQDACTLVDLFLGTGFDGGRHLRRVNKINEIEQSRGGE
ncbi:MAG TPA: ribose 5-phosphate isomerase B [Bryobacteraceae bacterium]|nr:ribose 5-phosphate isomerase B [Bryobacteraceae bacterium]